MKKYPKTNIYNQKKEEIIMKTRTKKLNDKQIIIQYLMKKKKYSQKQAKTILANRGNTTLRNFRLLMGIEND